MSETSKQNTWKISRRQFLKASAVTGAAISTGIFEWKMAEKSVAARTIRLNKPFKIVRTTCSPNCTGACGMKALVADGQVKAIIQASDYPEKEYNPRGCLKGLSFINIIYGPDRLQKPLIRTAERGRGIFKDASWDEALDHAAGRLKEIAAKYGPESIGVIFQVGGTGYVQKGALVALATMAGWTLHHPYDQNGDLPMFWPMTFGVQTEELEPLEWLNSRYVVIFGSNVMQTRLPDAHFLVEAREKGAKVVVVDPNFCTTAAKADEWIAIKPSADAAFALGLANVIVNENLYDAGFIKTYTDLPLLVRTDTGKKLLAKDVRGIGSLPFSVPEYRRAFVVFAGKPVPVNPENLELSVDPMLEGEVEVALKDGTLVKCKPVFQLLKENLADYTPEKAASICGSDAGTIRRLAREMATVKPLHVVYGASNYQWYHGDLKGRAIALIPVLTGNLGKPGAGISTYAGQYKIRFKLADWWVPGGKKQNWLPFLYVLHGPTPTMKAKYPKNGIKALIIGWGNPFDQHNLANKLVQMARNNDLEFIMTMDFTRTTTVNYSDVVLPAATWYEKTELTASPVHPYLQLQQPAVKPLYDSKPELEICRELAKRLDPAFSAHFFPGLDPDAAAREAIKLMLKNGGEAVKGITLDQLKKGPVRLNLGTPGNRQIPFYDQIANKKPFPPPSLPAPLEATAQFVKSGRVEFYKDEDLFLETGEALPVHKPPFVESEYKLDAASRKYSFVFITRNSLYRVHSTHSDNIWMNELQGFKPRVWLNPGDAGERGISEGELVEVYNSRGGVKGYAVLDHGVQRKVVIFEEGWWAKYLHNESYNSLTYPWIKPISEVYFVPGIWSPNTAWNECLCDIKKAGDN